MTAIFKRIFMCLMVSVLGALPLQALAHPHMWVEGQMSFGFNAQGQVTGVTQTWLFDELFSSYAKQGLPEGSDAAPAQSDLDKIGKSWIEALADPMSHYFTTIRYGSQEVATGPAQRVKVTWHKRTQQMALTFELPLLTPLTVAGKPLVVSVADPTFYVAYSYEDPNAVKLLGAPERCQGTYIRPKPLDMKTAQRLAAIPSNVTELPDDLMAVTQTLQHRVELSCQ